MLLEASWLETAFLDDFGAPSISSLNISKKCLSHGISLPVQLCMLKHRVLQIKLTTRKLPVFFEPALDSLGRIAIAPELLAKHVA